MNGSFLAFLSISVLVIVTPGPDTAMTIRNALIGGRHAGAMTALGVAAGQMIWASATSAGLVALLLASEPVFLAVKLAGAAYLIWLGAQALYHALRPVAASPISAGPAHRLAPRVAFRQGLISDLGNPKMAAFFSSLLPQFVTQSEGAFLSLLGLGLAFCLMTLFWLMAYAFVIAKAGDVLRRPAVRRTLEGLTGAVLVGLGLRIAAEQR